MKIMENPQLKPLYAGEQFKVLEVSLDAGAEMPLHYCTSEVVVTVQQGQAILMMDDTEKQLLRGSSVMLPARKIHALKVEKFFKALVVMARQATIEYSS